jgi:hypothetical protein
VTAVEPRPRGVSGLLASPPRAVALTILAGARPAAAAGDESGELRQ